MKTLALTILILVLSSCGSSGGGSSPTSPMPTISPSGAIVIPTPTPQPIPACNAILVCVQTCANAFPFVDDQVIDRQDAAAGILQSGAHITHINANHLAQANYAACLLLPANHVIVYP